MYVSPDPPGVPEVQPIPRPSVGWRRRPVPDDMLLEPAANRPFTTDEERPEVAWAPPAERRAVEAPAADSLDNHDRGRPGRDGHRTGHRPDGGLPGVRLAHVARAALSGRRG